MKQGCSFCTFDDGHLMTSFDIAYTLSKEYGVPENYILDIAPHAGGD